MISQRDVTAGDYVPTACGYITDCWIWQRGSTLDGYGRKSVAGVGDKRRLVAAHRWYYEQAYGEIPAGLQLDHLCRNPRCCRPDHLEPVTLLENVRRSGATKLCVAQVREIKALRVELLKGRSRLARGAREMVAVRYGVTPRNISAIWDGTTWGDV